MDDTAQQPKLEGGKLWKRSRQGEQCASEEQCKEQRGRLRKLFNPVLHRLKVQEESIRWVEVGVKSWLETQTLFTKQTADEVIQKGDVTGEP